MAVALREVLASFGVEWDSGPLERGNARVDGAISKLKAFGAALGASAVVLGLKNMVSELEAQAGALDDSATRLGLSTDELQAYRYAAKMAGLEVASFDQALGILVLNQGAAAEGSKAQAEAFKAVGVEADGAALSSMTLSELLPQIAEGLAKVESTSERARMAQQLFGKQGAKLAPLLGQGAAGVAKFQAEIDKLGGGLSGEGLKALTQYGDQMDRLDMATTSAKLAIAKGVVPTMSILAEKLAFGLGRAARFASSIVDIANKSNILTAAFTVLGAAGLGKVFALAGGWRGIIGLLRQAARVLGVFLLRLALPALLIDELITTWQGGDTIIRRILDGWFGEGMTAQIVGFFKLLTGGWESVVFVVDSVATMIGAIIVGLAEEIGNNFAMAWASVQDAAGSAWNAILETVRSAIAEIAALIDSATASAGRLADKFGLSSLGKWIKGAGGDLAKSVADRGAGLAAATGGNRAMVEQEYWKTRTERVEVFDAAKRGLGQRIAEVNSPTTVNVTVPPGTPASMANRVGQAAAKAVQPSRRATHAALTHRAH